MNQFPTEEEEFELMVQVQDEMQIDQEEENLMSLPIPTTKEIENTLCQTEIINKLIRQSPHSSQNSFGNLSQINNYSVNRKLFNTPISSNAKTKYSSTPFHKSRFGRVTNLTPSIESNSNTQNIELKFNQENDLLDEFQNVGLNRKRKIQELFGDIYDIDDSEQNQELKKLKNEEERDFELIRKILDARKEIQGTTNPLRKKNDVEKLNILNLFKKMNMSRSVPKWPFIPIKNGDNERVYMRFHSKNFEEQQINKISCCGAEYNSNKGVLGETKLEVWNEAKEIFFKYLTKSSTTNDSEGVEIIESNNVSFKSNEILWVEKYKPNRYIDLLSDETTNRCLLFWLKMWDKIVFGREPKKKLSSRILNNQPKMNSFNKKTGRFESNGGWNRRIKQNLNTECDELGRPIQKIALLCGPPGLGKTTLAQTIAKHAGYSIREMNASDDRNPDAFRLALENGTQMTSILNEEKKPNCIILDEIDGAPAQSIDFLIQFINDNYSSKTRKNVSGQKSTKNILRRPIICICNDMYTPALRQLRQIAFVVNFPPIESSRLAERLLNIAYKEKMLTDLSTLLALAEKSGNDVRSCISMMQFFNANKKRLTLKEVLTSTMGQKDGCKGLFSVWNAIFQIERPQRQVVTIESGSEKMVDDLITTTTTMQTRANNILKIVHSGGDYERLMQGVFENYLQQKMPDPYLGGVVDALHWFCFSDLLQHQITKLQNYTVYPYLQYGFVMWHFLFSHLAWPKIVFPNKGYEINQKTTLSKMVFQSFKKGLTCNGIGIGQGKVILIDTIPLLKKILSPNLRCVSLQLLTSKERCDLTHTVQVMADLGLSFNQIKAADGTYQYSMEPNIDLLCKYENFQGITLSYFGRQLIAREVELEQMNRAVPKEIGDRKSKILTGMQQPNIKIPNHLQYLKPQVPKNVKQLITKDFFGRIIAQNSEKITNNGVDDSLIKSPIWYRYKEGFNNAVRKDVTISNIL